MFKTRLIAICAFAFFASHHAFADLVGSYPPEGGPITVSPTGAPVKAGGLEFTSQTLGLGNGDSAQPFTFFLTGNNKADVGKIAMGALRPVTIDGPITLDVTATDYAVVEAQWGNGAVPTLFPINGGVSASNLQGSFPFDGGPITLSPVLGDSSGSLRELQLLATTGGLVGGANPAPFASLVENTAQKWSVSSAADVVINGSVVLDVAAGPNTRINGSAGDGTGQVNFRVSREAPPATDRLQGYIPYWGGPVSIHSTGAVNTRGIDLSTNNGTFASGGDPSPYSTLEANTSKNWAASSATDVVLDGRITLDVTATRRADVQGVAKIDGVSSTFPVEHASRFIVRGDFPFDGGPITLTSSTPLATKGVDIQATAGTLTGGGSAAPYSTLTNNTANHWTATSTADVVLDGRVTLDVVASSDTAAAGILDDGIAPSPIEIKRNPAAFTSKLRGSFAAGGGPITLQTTEGPFVSRGLSLLSAPNRMTGGASPAPFETVVTRDDKNWIVSSTSDVIIDGDVTLDVGAKAGARINARTNDGTTTKLFSIFEDGVVGGLHGVFPANGGQITVAPTAGPIQAGGVQFDAIAGTITPGTNPSPFTFFLPNADRPSQVTLGSLSPVLIDGPVTLDIAASADAEVEASWGNGITPVSFSVDRSDDTTIPNNEIGTVAGSYALQGGPVSLYSVGAPVSLRKVALSATKGTLSGGGGAAPFETVTANTDKTWSAESTADVVIDGVVELDVTTGLNSLIKGEADSGSGGLAFSLNGLTGVDFSSDIIATFPEGGGQLTLLAPKGPVETSTFELSGAPGILMAGEVPAPFDFMTTDPNDPGKIILGMNSGTVVIDAPLTIDITASGDANFFGTWGQGTLGTFNAVAVPNLVPEPSTNLMMLLGMVSLLYLRRGRTKK